MYRKVTYDLCSYLISLDVTLGVILMELLVHRMLDYLHFNCGVFIF